MADRDPAGALRDPALYVADRRPQTKAIGDIGLTSAVAVGLAQSLSLMPGVSRSGITITAGRFLGLDRDSAARFSFLLLVPITFGAVALQGREATCCSPICRRERPGPFVVGIARVGSRAALVAISALLGYVRRHNYTIFVVYRLLPRRSCCC